MDPDYAKRLKAEMRSQPYPSFSFINFRELCKISIGNIFGYTIMLAIPREELNLKDDHMKILSVILVPSACALGNCASCFLNCFSNSSRFAKVSTSLAILAGIEGHLLELLKALIYFRRWFIFMAFIHCFGRHFVRNIFSIKHLHGNLARFDRNIIGLFVF